MRVLHINVMFLFLLGTPVMCQSLVGNNLKIGDTPNSNQGGAESISVGNRNLLWTYASLGQYHARRSVVIGVSNSIISDDSIVTGSYNNSDYWEETDGHTIESAVFGRWNWITGDSSLIVGTANSISRQRTGTGDYDWEKPKNAVVMGTGLINRFNNCIIVGKNNLSVFPTQPHSGPSPLFIVGNGASGINRSNALEVLSNGDIIIHKPQGDVAMGNYQ